MEEITQLITLLFNQHGKLLLTTQETSVVTGRSVVSLERDRYAARGIPSTKLGNGGSDRALYSINDIAKYIVARKAKVL